MATLLSLRAGHRSLFRQLLASSCPPKLQQSPQQQQQQRRPYGLLDTPEEKSVYPGLKRIAEAVAKQRRREVGGGEDASEGERKEEETTGEEEPSNRRLDAARRYDNAARAAAASVAPSLDPAAVASAVAAAAAAAAAIVGPLPASPDAWSSVGLSDPAMKFALLTDCIRRLGRPVPNSRLAEIATLADALEHFLRPPEPAADPLKRLAASPDLPENVHVQVEPLRFTDNPAFFGGLDAFPGRDTLVTQPWARAKYRSKIAPPMRSPRWSAVGRNPGSLSEMLKR